MGKSFVPKKVSSLTGKLVDNTNTFSKKLLPKSIYKTTHQYKVIVFLLVAIILFALIWHFLRKRESYEEDESNMDYDDEEYEEGFVEGSDYEEVGDNEDVDEEVDEEEVGDEGFTPYEDSDTILSEF